MTPYYEQDGIGVVFPLALAIGSTFSPQIIRGLLLVLAVAAATWTFHRTEFAAERSIFTGIAFVVFLMVACGVWFAGRTMDAPEKTDSILSRTEKTPAIDPWQLLLYTQYAYEWNHYLGSTNLNERTSVREIDQKIPLHKQWSAGEHALFLGINNHNHLPVDRVSLEVITPATVKVRQAGHWILKFASTYQYEVGELDSISGKHADAALYLEFPKADTYPITITIKGRGLDPVDRSFRIVMDPTL